MLFIDARGRYLAEHQLYVVMAVVLNFHAKAELEMLQSGAGRPGDPTIWPPIFVDGLDCLLEVGGEGLGPKHVIDRPVGLP